MTRRKIGYVHINISLAIDWDAEWYLVWSKWAALDTTIPSAPCVIRNSFIGKGVPTDFIYEKQVNAAEIQDLFPKVRTHFFPRL